MVHLQFEAQGDQKISQNNHILGENKDEFVNPLPLMISRRPLWGT